MKVPTVREIRDDPGFYLTATLLILALLLGGSGTRPYWSMTIELIAAVTLGYFAMSSRYAPVRGSWIPLSLLAAVVLLLLWQLVPIGWERWSALPGRSLAAQMLTLAGLQGASLPSSLTPEATRDSALALLPGAAMLVAVLHLGSSARVKLVKIAIAAALLSAALGAVQYATNGHATLFDTAHRGFPIGLFSNRNQQADLLMIGLVMLAALGGPKLFASRRRGEENGGPWLKIGLIVTLAVATIATTSRMGVSLLPLALFVALLLLLRLRGRRALTIVGGTVLVATGAVFLLSQNAVVSRTFDRYSTAESDARYEMWEDTIFAIPQYLPIGSGMGSFVPVYETVESAQSRHPAHGQPRAQLLPSGRAGGRVRRWALLLGFFGFIVWASLGLIRPSGDSGEDRLALAALGGIAILLLHSIVDYPLRMLSLAAVMGLLCGLLLRTRTQRAD